MAIDKGVKEQIIIENKTTSSEETRSVSPAEPTTSSPAKPKEPTAFKNASTADEPASVNVETNELLKVIQKQLRVLSQNVADLETKIEECQHSDYQAVLSKIDAARDSIEKVVGGIAPTSSKAADPSVLDKIAELEALLNGVAEKQDRNDRKLMQTLRENANFQVQVRQGMQHDIEELKKQQNGEQFIPILKEIATIYVEYQGLLEDESISGQAKNNLESLFEQLEDVLRDNDAEILRSEVGTVRQTRITKIIETIYTAEPEKHNTIAASRKPGVLRGRTVLYPEYVDVFVFNPSIAEVQNEVAASASIEEEKNTIEETPLDDKEPVVETSQEDVPDAVEAAESSESEEVSVEEKESSKEEISNDDSEIK